MKNIICILSIVLLISCSSRYKLEGTEKTIQNIGWEGTLIAVYESDWIEASLPAYLIIKISTGQCDLVNFAYSETGKYTYKQDTLTFYAKYSSYSDEIHPLTNPTKYIFVKKGDYLIHTWYDKFTGKKNEMPYKRLGGNVSAPLVE